MSPSTTTTRSRRVWAATFTAVAALAMGACSTDDGAAGNNTAEDSADTGTVTVTHSMGETEVPVNPDRVVTFSNQWFDTLTALDEPVTLGFRNSQAQLGMPWNDAEAEESVDYEGFGAEALTTQIESIAASEPDVILTDGLDDEMYSRLSDIAPTVSILGGGVVSDWRDLIEVSGQIFDKEDRASELRQEVEDRIEDVRGSHPGLDGATVAFGQVSENGIAVVTADEDPANEFLTELGLVVPDDIRNAGNGDSRAFIAEENIRLLDTDMLLMWAIEIDPSTITGWDDLTAVQDGTLYTLDMTDGLAFGTPSVLSVPWALDQLEPQFTAVDEARG